MMISWNVLRKRDHGTKGLALGFGIPLGSMPSDVLTGYAIAITTQAPLGVSFGDLSTARRLTQAHAPEIPLILFGIDDGIASVRAVILSHLTPPPAGVLRAGTPPSIIQGDVPLVWGPLLDRARNGKGNVVLATVGGAEWAGVLEGLGPSGNGVTITIADKASPPTPAQYLAALSTFTTPKKT